MRKQKLLYILSPSYSGSTLLTFLLGMHPAIATVGELKATGMGDIKGYHCSCGELLGACTFWSMVQREMWAKARPFRLDQFGTHFKSDNFICDRLLQSSVRHRSIERIREATIQHLPLCNKTMTSIMQQNLSMAEIILKLQHGTVLLDSSKTPVRLKHFARFGNWDLKVIHLLRDGRGVAYSMMKHRRTDMSQAAKRWLRAQRECQQTARLFDAGSLINVKYEDLCQAPESELGRILKFLGLELMELDWSVPPTKQHILGNAMRLNSAKQVKFDEKWKTGLARQEVEIFEHLAGRLNMALGYMG